MDHSGLAMQTTSFNDPWDRKEFGGEKMTGAIRKKAEDLMRSEVAAYDSYLRGECYGFELYKNGELTDSCWGFIGDLADVCKDMAESLMRKSWEITFDLNPKLLTHPEQVKVLRFALKPHLEFLKTLDEVLAESSGESSKTA